MGKKGLYWEVGLCKREDLLTSFGRLSPEAKELSCLTEGSHLGFLSEEWLGYTAE